MIPPLPTDPARRARRKADLLLASQVLRGQATLAVNDVGERADVWGRRWLTLKGWLADPMLLAAGGATAAFMAGAGRRRRPLLKGLRLSLLAWRIWRDWGAKRPKEGQS